MFNVYVALLLPVRRRPQRSAALLRLLWVPRVSVEIAVDSRIARPVFLVDRVGLPAVWRGLDSCRIDARTISDPARPCLIWSWCRKRLARAVAAVLQSSDWPAAWSVRRTWHCCCFGTQFECLPGRCRRLKNSVTSRLNKPREAPASPLDTVHLCPGGKRVSREHSMLPLAD